MDHINPTRTGGGVNFTPRPINACITFSACKIALFLFVTFPKTIPAFKQAFFEVTSISLIIHNVMTFCQKRVKQHGEELAFGTRTINGMKNSNITTNFTVDIIFINYSWMMTPCQNAVNQHQIGLKLATRVIIRTRNA